MGCLFVSCETDPVVNLGMKPTPIVYAIFDQEDSTNNIFLTKTFSGEPLGPYVSSKVYDSLFFKDVRIRVELRYAHKTDSSLIMERIWLEPNAVLMCNGDSGVFSTTYLTYSFNKSLADCFSIKALVGIPNQDTLALKTIFIEDPILKSPQSNGSFISLKPNSPFSIRWIGQAWNEIELRFAIITNTESGEYHDTLVYHKHGLVLPEDPLTNLYVSFFSFDAYLALLNSQLPAHENVVYRELKDISLKISCGSEAFKNYMERTTFFQTHDYSTNGNLPSNLFTTKSSEMLKDLKFDPASVEIMKSDIRLAKFGFVYW